MAMQISRQRVADVLRKAGYPHAADEALRDLRDVVDLKDAQDWSERHGVSRERFVDLMGGSP
jgi:predicted DNA-binding protein (UPF0251 family)